MTKKKFALFTALGILATFLALEGTSWAPVMKTPDPMENFIKYPVIGEWTWFSPLEGVRYGMNQFADGTIVALHRPRDPRSLQDHNYTAPYTILSATKSSLPDQFVPWRSQEGQNNIRISLVQATYDLWLKRSIRCNSRRNATDMLGNTFEICNTAPFRFETPYGQSTSDSDGGEVWIIIPPASGKQEPARRSNRPGWGR